MTTPLSSVIIGTGGIAHAHVNAARSNAGRTQLAAAMDIDAERVSAFCESHEIPRPYTDLTQMLEREKPALVHICTPPSLHCDQIIQALEASGWNRQKTAKALGINRTTLYKKMKRYEIDFESVYKHI